MTRWLLNTFPTWTLTLLVIAAFVLLTLGGLRIARRLLPEAREDAANEFAGVMAGVVAAVYGVFLAFAIVALYDELHEANEEVRSEAAALAQIVRNGEGLGPAPGSRVRDAVRAYRDTVVGAEWRAMEDGEHSEDAWRGVDRIYASLRAYEPQGERESAFYGEAVAAVNELVDVRRARLHAAESSLPGTLMLLLIGGAFLTLGFALVYAVPHRAMHTGIAVSLAVLLGFCVLAAVVLDHPFSGDVSVSTDPYHEGALAGL